jgi:PRC-barrel domain
MKMLLTATAMAIALTAVPALAQTAKTPEASDTTVVAPAPVDVTKDATTVTKDTMAVTTADDGKNMWLTQGNAELRASKLIGSTVTNAAGESIGDINEVLLGQDGKMAAVVIGVGGFLGLGEREVAVKFDALKMQRATNGSILFTVDVTKETLQIAPVWTWPKMAL